MRITALSSRTVRSGFGFAPVLAFVVQALAVWRERRALERLDDAALRDIGISRHAAERESARKLWDVPKHWTN